MTRLALTEVGVTLHGRAVVAGASLTLVPGECVGLIGPNGAGKTTLMRAALGLIPATGQITLNDTPIAALPARTRARLVAYLPQDRDIAWPISVRDLVSLGRGPHQARGAALSAADHAAIAAALSAMEIAHLADRPATRLSGGERARVLIARALAQEAPLILADEPTAGLDPAHQLGLMALLRRRAAAGIGILVSLHDLGQAARWCDRLVVMAGGRIVADGPPVAVLTPDLLARVFGIVAHWARDECGPILLPIARIPP